jgi:hypothetical protein
MTAQPATADDRLLTRERQARSIRDGFIVPEVASDKPLFGGMKFDCGYLSPYFVTDPERMEVTFENVYVLIHEKPINSRKDLRPLLEQIRESGKPLLIIAEDVGGAALATLVVNKLRGPLQGTQSRGSAQEFLAGHCPPHRWQSHHRRHPHRFKRHTDFRPRSGHEDNDRQAQHGDRSRGQVRPPFL